eukprot:CAMPEP_0197024988 /NCGR_PEP_ID=MMETSP1384-20130603/5440_1 /TAXON_ID=29189 /ORGANISM="Ammonia sp." /LENGTH=447 /DNA_ID=CAMNT_0042453463 /DNA_START=228 /DNA_END=1571 /DNA_ORIENTATION=+
MFIDLDVFEQNVKTLVSFTQKHQKTLRLATKSIRCPHLIQHAIRVSDGGIKGIMCYSVHEANALVEYAQTESKKQDDSDSFNYTEAFNDILIAYPTVQPSDIETAYKLTQKGVHISLMVDCVQHIRIIDELCNTVYCNTSCSTMTGKTPTSHSSIPKLSICIDLDLSYRVKCLGLRLGAHRSNVYDEYDLNMILNELLKSKFLKLSGVMGYEAHVAGQPDCNPHSLRPNWMIKCMKPMLQTECNQRRQALVQFIKNKIEVLEKNDIDDDIGGDINQYKGDDNNNLSSFSFINAGGTGNCHLDLAACTEVTAGSGMIQSKIFDYYLDSQCQPAAAFALQVTRISVDEQYVTCQSGGFIASGHTSKDKEPVPFLPRNQVYGAFDGEGFGEVQTPLRVRDAAMFNYGDAIFFRPAKAGEIAEHFNEYILKREDKIVQKVPTYRGMGYAFY